MTNESEHDELKRRLIDLIEGDYELSHGVDRLNNLLDRVHLDGLDDVIKDRVLDWIVTALQGSAPVDGRPGRFVLLSTDELKEAQSLLSDETHRDAIERMYDEDGEETDRFKQLPASVLAYVECLLPLP